MTLTEADKRVVRAFVNEKPADSRLLDTDGRKLDKMGLGGETVAKWIDGRIAIVSTESAKSDESIIRLISKEAGPGVVDFSYARKGHRVHEHGAMGRNGRGIYHETAAGKHDMVLHQDHRGRWAIDLVTTAGGNHVGVGLATGYLTPEAAFQVALDVQRIRGIRGKSHVWIADRDGNLSDYEPMQANGQRTGILSDGTRINVYYSDKEPNEPWTVVPHNMDWDAQARGDMRMMLGMSEHATGVSQFTEGMEGRHLGRLVPWDAVPSDIKRHIESRLVSEGSMVANARRKTKGVTVDDLGESSGGKVLACPSCGAEFSAIKRDYFMMPKGEVLACQACKVPLVLRKRTPARLPPPQEARHSPGNRAWDAAEDKGLVRMVVEEEQDNYFDVYGKPESEAEYDEIVEILNRDGLNYFASQYRRRPTDEWETAAAIGMVIGDLASSGYEDSLKQAALDALKTAQKKR